jgi:hypothetical protein
MFILPQIHEVSCLNVSSSVHACEHKKTIDEKALKRSRELSNRGTGRVLSVRVLAAQKVCIGLLQRFGFLVPVLFCLESAAQFARQECIGQVFLIVRGGLQPWLPSAIRDFY